MFRKIVIAFLIFGIVMMVFGSCGVCRCAAGAMFCNNRGYRSSYHRRGYGSRRSSSFFFFNSGGSRRSSWFGRSSRRSSRRSSLFSRSSYRSRGFSFGK